MTFCSVVGLANNVAEAVESAVNPKITVRFDHIPHTAEIIRQRPQRLIIDSLEYVVHFARRPEVDRSYTVRGPHMRLIG